MLKIQRNLMYEAVKRAAGAIVVTDDPADYGQYLSIKYTPETINLTVTRHDVVSRIIIDKADSSILEADSPGSFSVRGDRLLEALNGFKTSSTMSVKLKKTDVADSDETSVKAEFRMPGIKKDDVFSMVCADIDIVPNIDERGTDRVTVNGSKFIKYAKAIGISVGKATHNPGFSNVSLSVEGNDFKMIGINDIHITKAKFLRSDAASSDFQMIIPYEMILTAIKVLDPNQDIEIIYNSSAPRTVVFNQDFVHAGGIIGKFSFRVSCAMEKFVNFEKTLSKLDFPYVAKINTQRLKSAVNAIANNFIDDAKTTVKFDSDSMLELSKTSATDEASTNVDFISATGGALELKVSSRHLKLALDCCEEDATEIYFSGERTLVMVKCTSDDTLKTYFKPFED